MRGKAEGRGEEEGGRGVREKRGTEETEGEVRVGRSSRWGEQSINVPTNDSDHDSIESL